MLKGIKGFQKGHIQFNTGRTHFKKGTPKELHPRWKGGLPKCKDCGKETSRVSKNRCKECNKKYQVGKNSAHWKGGKPKCIKCGKPLSSRNAQLCKSCAHKGKKINKPRTEEYRKKISTARRGKWLRENNPNWKGGTSGKDKLVRSSLEYIIWRSEVYKRDGWACRLCGIKCNNKNITAHHLKLFSEFPELRFVVDNGITLCRSCHMKLHFH